MGNRLATIDMGQKVGAAVPLSVGWGLGPHLTQCGLWAEAYLPTKWHLDPSNRLDYNTPTLQTDKQDRQRTHSMGRTVTCNGRPKKSQE